MARSVSFERVCVIDLIGDRHVVRIGRVREYIASVTYAILLAVFLCLQVHVPDSHLFAREFWGLILVATVVAAWWGSLLELLTISLVGAVVWCGLEVATDGNWSLVILTNVWRLSMAVLLMLLSCWARRELGTARASARIDPLTQLSNRRAIFESIDAELERARRTGRSFAVALLDCDGFKAINDLQGHLAGDVALQRIAAGLRAQTRTYDAVGRLGGDEFVLVLSGTEADEVPLIFERLRNSLRIELAPSYPTLSFSLGVVTIRAIDVVGNASLDPTECLRQADEAMYAAKRSGDDRSCFRAVDGRDS